MITTIIKNERFVGSCGKKTLLDIIQPLKLKDIPIVIFAHGFKGFKDWGQFPLMIEKLAENQTLDVKYWSGFFVFIGGIYGWVAKQ